MADSPDSERIRFAESKVLCDIDLDLLIYDNVNLSSAELTLPHPYIMEREFVLKPLTELTSDEKYITALNNLKQGTVWLYEP